MAALYIRHSERSEESLSTNARQGSYAKALRKSNLPGEFARMP
jgi:hypothetical protein